MKKAVIKLLGCMLAAVLLFTMIPEWEFLAGTDNPQKVYAATLSVKSLWASEHSVGKVLFKWTKQGGVTVSGWNLKYRFRKIGGNNTWSGWTQQSYPANTYEAWIPIETDYVIEIHAQGAGDTTWSTGIITCPAGGRYQAMKTTHVLNVDTQKRLSESSVEGSAIAHTAIHLEVGQSIRVRPDYDYSVLDFNKRPRLYPNHLLYDIADKSMITITKPDGSTYTGGIIDGVAEIKAKKAGSTSLVFRSPNGRTMIADITINGSDSPDIIPFVYPDTYVQTGINTGNVYTFDGSINGTDASGNPVALKDVLASNDSKRIILKGTIQFTERYKVGSNTEIDATEGKTGVGAGATIYSGANGDGCLTNEITSGNYDSTSNIIIKGGTWKKASGYHNRTMMLFAHASNIRVESICEECSYDGGHCVELVACKDVIVKNCDLQMKGNNFTNNEDEPLQLDHANRITSPTIPGNLMNNNPCINVQINGCTLQGGRGLCSGHCGSDASAQNYYHYNVVIQNNNITGQTSEALALYNVVGCEVTGNTIRTLTPDITNYRSDGMCVRIPAGSTAPADMAKSAIVIKNNVVYGGRSGIIVNSLSESDFGHVTITGNIVYYKGEDKNAITVSKWYNNTSSAGCVSKVISDNSAIKGW